MTAEERIALLQSMPFFGAIKDSSIALILGLSKTLTFKKDDIIFQQGDRGDSLFLLEQGSAVIYKHADNQAHILRQISDGDCFGELALIDFTPRSASVKAESDCTAIKIPSSALHSLFQKDPEQFLIIQMNIGREVSRRLRAADDRWFQLQVATGSNHTC